MLKLRCEVPDISGYAAEQVQAKRSILGERVAGKVRFREQAQAGNTAAARKLVPLRGAHWTEAQVANQSVEESAEEFKVPQSFRTTPLRINNPLNPTHSSTRKLLLCVSAFRAKLADSRNWLAAIHTELGIGSGRPGRGWCRRFASCGRARLLDGIHHRLPHGYPGS
jgi:hypothetical protein